MTMVWRVFGGDMGQCRGRPSLPKCAIIHTIGGQEKCSVRSIFSCCFALAIMSRRVVGAVVANAQLGLFATRRPTRGTCLPQTGI